MLLFSASHVMAHRGFAALFSPLALLLMAGLAAFHGHFTDVSPDLVREPTIDYFSRSATDPVTTLNAHLQSGDASLALDETSGYLRSILNALQVPVEPTEDRQLQILGVFMRAVGNR